MHTLFFKAFKQFNMTCANMTDNNVIHKMLNKAIFTDCTKYEIVKVYCPRILETVALISVRTS